jgi:hypothetical protein
LKKITGCATISDGLTDRRKQSPAEIPTELFRRYFTESLKKITGCATISDGITDGTYRRTSPTEITHPEAPAVRETTITDG